ncbi:MAG: SUMF1/EgtB/PvdO family nonheme iron enzyme [Myxococcales bacterium]|nr:SUMF1/EgtB/PvdO family nonheme iron enzyme [Myxococcales bacterium]
MRGGSGGGLAGVAAALAVAWIALGCGSKKDPPRGGSSASVTPTPPRPSASASAGAPRPGMAWVPPGKVVAGTPVGRVPRIAEEEPAGVPTDLKGFYIDLYPHPNEAGALPTTNVSRDDAARQCEAKGKRLCTELEWERACKGPDDSTYEYGAAYRSATCGTGVAVEQAARSPIGERVACKSGFGVQDMHGGVWEWTQSKWARGAVDRDLAVLKGGNAVAGEIVGRCANASARPPSTKAATVGFRCCAGPKNEAEVALPHEPKPSFERSKNAPAVSATLGAAALAAWGVDERSFYNYPGAWLWRPVANEELVVLVGCTPDSPTRCAVAVGRVTPKPVVLAQFKVGAIAPTWELAPNDSRVLRGQGFRPAGAYRAELRYLYGRIDLVDGKP